MQVRSDILISLRLLNAARFSSGMASAIANVRQFHDELDVATTRTQQMGATATLAQGVLSGFGAVAKGVALAVGALSVATVGFGIQFNATMESNALAFDKFAGGAMGAKRLTKDLFEIAARTPFSFEDITTGARRLLAFGFNVQETTDLLTTMGDAISYTGGSQDEILRLGKALGDIRAKGRLMQQEMNQLANVGIPIREILARGGLELTQKQLENIGRAGIPADQALTAISAGLKDMYGGGAEKYLNTFNGQLQRLRDNLRQTAGSATESSGLFGWAKGGLKTVNDNLDPITKFFKGDTFKGIAGTVGGVLSTAFTGLVGAVKMLFEAIKPAAPFFQNILWPLLKGFAVGLIGTVVAAFHVFVIAIKAVAHILGFLGKIAGALGLDKVFYAIGFVLSFFVGVVLRAIGFVGKIIPLFGKLGAVVAVLGAPIRLYSTYLGFLFSIVARGAGFAFRLLQRFAPMLATGLSAVANFGRAVRTRIVDGFIKAFTFLGNLPGIIGRMFLKAGLAIGDFLFRGMKERLFKLFAGTVGILAAIGPGIRKWLNDHTLFGNEINLGFAKIRIPMLAKGGTFNDLAIVGEKGPELARHTPHGTVITPLRSQAGIRGLDGAGAMGAGATLDGIRAHFEIPLYLDRNGHKKIGEAVGEYVSDRRSRA